MKWFLDNFFGLVYRMIQQNEIEIFFPILKHDEFYVNAWFCLNNKYILAFIVMLSDVYYLIRILTLGIQLKINFYFHLFKLF